MAGFCSHFGRSFGGQNMSKSSLSSAVPPVISRRVKRWKFALPSFERSKSPGSRAVAILFIHKQLTEITCPWKYQTDKQTVLIVVQITPRSRSVFHVHSLIQDLSKSVNLCGRCGKYWRRLCASRNLIHTYREIIPTCSLAYIWYLTTRNMSEELSDWKKELTYKETIKDEIKLNEWMNELIN